MQLFDNRVDRHVYAQRVGNEKPKAVVILRHRWRQQQQHHVFAIYKTILRLQTMQQQHSPIVGGVLILETRKALFQLGAKLLQTLLQTTIYLNE